MGIRYNPALDGLRAIAALAVIEHHADWHSLGINGFLGVDVFFVLSGFLITSILLREEATGGIRLGAFYLRRARRLYPALCVLVAVTLLLHQAAINQGLVVLLYLGDYIGAGGAFGHAWTLGVEEHFYLLWPLALPFIARMERRRAVALLLAAYIAASLWSAFTPWEWRAVFRFDARTSGLLFGSLLAFLPRNTWLPFVALAVAIPFSIYGNDRPFAEAATACIILLSYRTTIPFLTRAPLVYLGRISYGVYLYHWPIVELLHRIGVSGMAHLGMTVVGSVACAALSYHTIEAYFRKPRHVSYPGMQQPAA